MAKSKLERKLFVLRPAPVFHKGQLQLQRRWANNLHMGIPPVGKFGILTQIFISYIVPPYPTRFSIHYYDLTVIAKIQLKAISPALRRMESAR